MRKVAMTLAICTFLLVSVLMVSFTTAKEVTVEAKKVDYVLPYPGLLPDHPFYSAKKVRDKILIFFSRDYIKKAELYLLFSDKKIYMSIELAKRDSWKLSSETATASQSDFSQAIMLVQNAKKQGLDAPAGFIQKLKMSNEKHREVLEILVKTAPDAERGVFEKALSQTTTIKNQLSSF